MPAPKKPTKKTPSPRQMSGKYRDWAQNRKKPAPYGRFEDGSPRPTPKGAAATSKRMTAQSKAIKKK